MALDAATLALTAGELKQTLTDAKIAKIFEPTRDELVLTLRTRTETYALLLSARSGSARVCLTEESFENPETPPSFCMLMRKHLTGGKLLDVRMEPGDRIVYFTFQCTNEMGDLVQNILCAELMGRYSNLVLVQNGKIIDALKRVDFEDSDVRQLLPGLPYTIPPKPARPDFLQVSAASIVAAACERDLPVADALNKTVAGVGPVVCREAAWRAFDGEHLLANELDDAQKRKLMAAIDELKELHHNGGCPCSVTAPDGKPVEFTFFRPMQYGDTYIIKEWPSFNALLEGYYAEKDRAERLRTKSKELHKAVHNMYERAVRKQAARQEELAASGKSEKLRLYGELLSANLYMAQKGMKSITVPNWYDEGKEVTIPLDDKAFRYWNVLTNHWEVEGGCYELRVGASCEDIRLRAVITVEGTAAPDPYEGKDLHHYQTAEVRKITDAEFEALLGRPIPESKIKIDRNMTLGELNHSRSPLGWLIWLVLTALLNASYKRGKPNLNVMFQYNMPLRALAKMTSGAISMGMVDGIVMELQGFWIIGLVRVIIEAVKNLVLNAQLEQRLRNS